MKFFAYLRQGHTYDGNVKEFLNTFMKEHGPKVDLAASKKLFVEVVSHVLEFTGGPLLRKGYAVTPLNQLEAVLVGAGRLAEAGKKLKKPSKDWLNDSELVKFSTKGTNTKTAFTGRNRRAEALLAG